MHFSPDSHTTHSVLENFGKSIVHFAAQADTDEQILLSYDRDALLELGVMLLFLLRESAREKAS